MTCHSQGISPTSFVPVCASVICEAPGVIYVSIDPEVWKIRCRQCQEKTEHKCALKKLKAKFRPSFLEKKQVKDKDEYKREMQYEEEEEDDEDEDKDEVVEEEEEKKPAEEELSKDNAQKQLSEINAIAPIPDNYCACADRPMDVTQKPNVCYCEIYKPLNFMFELEVTGEYKPAYVPKARKGKE